MSPTGYTAPLYEGEEITFAEFAMNCARAFGAMVELRDSPSAPIPEKFKPSEYHVKGLAKAEKRLAEVESWTPKQAHEEARRSYEKALEANRQSEQDADRRREAYEPMLAKVRAWEPPTEDHQGLKDFMVDQLEKSMEFDCRPFVREVYRQSGPEFKVDQLRAAKNDIEHHREGYEKDVQRAEQRTKWVQALRDSLEGIPA